MSDPQEQPALPKGPNRLVFVIGAAALAVFYLMRSTPENRRADALHSWAQRAQTHLPETIHEGLRVVEVGAGQDSIWFHLVLPQARKAELDLVAFRNREAARVRDRACTVFREVLTAGGYLGFRYEDRDGVHLTDIYILPSDCGLTDSNDMFMVQSMKHVADMEANGQPVLRSPMRPPPEATPGQVR